MAAFTSTQSDVVLGKLTNGKKIVHTTVTIADAGVTTTTITCRPLRKIDGWFLAFTTPATDTFICADGAAVLNTITVTPSADSTNDVLQFIFVGE
jgi:hypothetical protein